LVAKFAMQVLGVLSVPQFGERESYSQNWYHRLAVGKPYLLLQFSGKTYRLASMYAFQTTNDRQKLAST